MHNVYGIPISFYIAEVISIAEHETYTLKEQKSDVDDLRHVYEIRCKIVSPDPACPIIVEPVRPADINSKKIPLIGEQVLVFQGYREDSRINELQPCWYYLTTISILSDINNNNIAGLSKDVSLTLPPGTTFVNKTISPLQAYEGDVSVEGRFGNSIRFGSSFDTSKSKVERLPNYLGESGQPIILLSNRNKMNDDFATEDVDSDYSSLYLTSKQRISNLKTHNPVNNSISVSNFSNSQLIGVADRIVLKSKTDSVLIDGNQSIEINAPKIYIGSSTNKEPILHSDAVVKLLQKIVTILKIGFADSSGVVCTPIYDSLPDSDLETLYKQLTNDNIQIDAYKNNTLNT